MTIFRLVSVGTLLLLVSACESWLGGGGQPPLPGKRISVLSQDKDLSPEVITKTPILLPPPEPNDEWPQAGGYANHAMHHMEIGDKLEKLWTTNVGTGSGRRNRLLAQPVIALGRVFTVDSENEVTALNAATGKKLWHKDVTPEDMEGASGGGLAFEDGRLFVSTGFAQLVALDAGNGNVLWRQTLSGPMRGAPTVRGGRVMVITVDNQTHCLAAEDGAILWSHQGIAESAALLAGNSAAIDGNVAVLPYSSGELTAVRVENGVVLWQDSLATIKRTQAIANLTDIRGRPIIDRGRVFAISNADMLVGIDLRTGRRVWERQIGGVQSPWVAGDYLYVVTNANEAVALESKTGKILWVTQLQMWENPDDKKGRVTWSPPVLASDRLIFGSSHGYLLTLSPYDGSVLGKVKAPAGVTIQPAIASGTVYFFTDDADVVAYR